MKSSYKTFHLYPKEIDMNKLDIINAALRKVGVRMVTHEGESSQPLQAALGAFTFAAEEVLRSYAWNFATKYVTLAKTNEEPSFGYNSAFSLPADCALILDIRDSKDLASKEAQYALCGKSVFTNTNRAYCRYISNNVPISQWPVDFNNALATKIAADIALTSSQNPNAKQVLLQEYFMLLDTAMLNDNRENNDIVVDPLTSSDLLNRRWS